MKPELQRIKFAEACPNLWADAGWHWSGAGYLCSAEMMQSLDPLLSLDIVHDAEKTLTGSQLNEYADFLVAVVHGYPSLDFAMENVSKWAGDNFSAFTAPAEMRVEAFLKTLKLWKD